MAQPLGEISCWITRCFPGLIYFLLERFPRLSLQKEVQISAHHQVRRECDLMRSAYSFHQKLVQHAECHLALSARALVDSRGDSAGSNLRNKVQKQVGRDDS